MRSECARTNDDWIDHFGGLGEVTGGYWYVQTYLPAREKLTEAASLLDDEDRKNAETLIATADRMALAISNGDDSKAEAFGQYVGRMQAFIEFYGGQSRRLWADALEEIVRGIPRNIKDLVVETARTTGDALKASGVDPNELAQTAAGTLTKVAVGASVLGLGLLFWRFAPRRRRNPRRRR